MRAAFGMLKQACERLPGHIVSGGSDHTGDGARARMVVRRDDEGSLQLNQGRQDGVSQHMSSHELRIGIPVVWCEGQSQPAQRPIKIRNLRRPGSTHAVSRRKRRQALPEDFLSGAQFECLQRRGQPDLSCPDVVLRWP